MCMFVCVREKKEYKTACTEVTVTKMIKKYQGKTKKKKKKKNER